MVSERFKAFCEQHAFLNVVFRSPVHESYDYLPWERQVTKEGRSLCRCVFLLAGGPGAENPVFPQLPRTEAPRYR